MALDSIDWIFIGIITVCFVLLALFLLYHIISKSFKKNEVQESDYNLNQIPEQKSLPENVAIQEEPRTIYTYDNVNLDEN